MLKSFIIAFFYLFVFLQMTSFLMAEDPIEERITQLISQMTLDEKCGILHGLDMFNAPGIDRLGIPGITVSDGPHGVAMAVGTTCFPGSIALAATWDEDFMEHVGAAFGREFRGTYKSMALGPAIDIGRDPRNGRASETVGEEPYLGGKIFAPFIRGMQSTHLIACAKHFIAQNHDAFRDYQNPVMDKRTLREFYGLAFRMVVQEGEVYSIMASYNLVNGVHTSQYADILTNMLKNEWGYKYFVVSDWWGTYDTADALINAGLDMEMPDNLHYNGLKEAVKIGNVSEQTVDMAVRRTLRSKIKSGMMDPSTPKGDPADVNSSWSQIINRMAARKVMTLLKNQDDILPLKKTGTYALIGPNANDIPISSYGSSEVTKPAYKVSTRQGMANIAPSAQVIYEKGCDINSEDKSGFEAAKKAAKDADAVIFVGGLDRTQEGEAWLDRIYQDRTGGSVLLPGQQRNLIQELAAVNPNIIVVLQSGGIVSVGSAINSIKGLIYAWYCGIEGGNAIAEVLFGDVNPAGRLPSSMPVDDSQLPEWNNWDFTNDMIAGFGYRRYDKTGEKPLFNFGFGLSYTKFEYRGIRVSNRNIEGKDGVTISVNITNTGKRDGDEVAQLYLSSKLSVPMPVKQLRGFKRVNIPVGQTVSVDFVLTPYELSYWSESHNHYYVEPNLYTALVGCSSDDIQLQISFKVNSEYIIPYGYGAK